MSTITGHTTITAGHPPTPAFAPEKPLSRANSAFLGGFSGAKATKS
ncbi:MAG: hypothetical protein WCP28_16895 [Actinomycetes bacterium]